MNKLSKYRFGKSLIFLILFFLLFLCCSRKRNIQYREFANILDINGIPESAEDKSCYCFSDQGCWIGFGLPGIEDTAYWGGFTGPYLMEDGKWTGPSLLNVKIENTKTKEENILTCANPMEINYFPGCLSQRFRIKKLEIETYLIYISSRTAVVKLGLNNSGEETEFLQLSWQGHVFPGKFFSLKPKSQGVVMGPCQDSSALHIQVPESYQVTVSSSTKESYKIVLTSPDIIKPGEKKFRYIFCSLIFNEQEKKKEQFLMEKFIIHPDKYFSENRKRWNSYVKRVLNPLQKVDKSYKEIAVKSLLTLMTNWRSKAGDLYFDGLFPSFSPGYFNGFWAWDSWKHSAALASFAPQLAKDQIRTMFAYQREDGMIPDVIYKEKKSNNWRNTKPPLAAWAVWKIYKKTGDFNFIQEMLPKLIKYHNWWYSYRDHDENGLCEYGSTDGTIVAAKWESGMDDGVRFDNSSIVKNKEGSWSLTQESVDLNSYLYAEKMIIARFMNLRGDQLEAESWFQQANLLKEKIREYMFDAETGFFYDINLKDRSLLKVQGSEGWIPLWAGVATQKQAKQVLQVMTDTSKFATNIPLPTVSADNPEFMKGYWRGPVWLDQVYFGIRGLDWYGYTKESDKLRRQIFNRLQGLKDNFLPIYENYDPINGRGLRAAHFSWSAAHLLLMLWGE